MLRRFLRLVPFVVVALGSSHPVFGDLITDPNDPRSWQGATVGTFALLYYGADTPENRQLVVDNQLLDDGLFDFANSAPATLLSTPWSDASGAGGCLGVSEDQTGTGSYSYACSGSSVFENANGIDNRWFQSSGTIGDTVFDLGALAPKAAIFNTIDHGPLPQEAIESTAYLSNDLVNWTQAEVQRVWLEGFHPALGVLWDGFVFVVGTPSGDDFRYVSIVHGGPGALINDGDDEINGVLAVGDDFDACGSLPSFANYGDGNPGALGVPSLTLSDLPSLGSQIDLLMGNSTGQPTHACFLWGYQSISVQTSWGFQLLVVPRKLVPVFLAPGTTPFPFQISRTLETCGSRVYFQLGMLDSAAPGGIATSQGLEMVVGS